MKKYLLYIHIDPRHGEPFYIGKGQDYRPWGEGPRNKRWKARVREIRDAGYDREVRIFAAEDDEETAFILERFWIGYIGRVDLSTGPLLNMTRGGAGISGVVRTPEWIKNQADARRGKKWGPLKKPAKERSVEARRKQGETLRRKGIRPPSRKGAPPLTEEQRQRLSDGVTRAWAKRKALINIEIP